MEFWNEWCVILLHNVKKSFIKFRYFDFEIKTENLLSILKFFVYLET